MDGLILLFLGAVAFLVIGIAWQRVSLIEMGDFKVVYYSARCLLQHGDPYKQGDVLRVYRSEGRESPSEPALDREVKTRFFYPPTAFIFTLPFAAVGFGIGKVIWTVFLAASFVLAAVAMWDVAADFAPLVSGLLAGLLLMSSFWLFMIGNSAGVAVSLCVLAAWCFCRDRFIPAGLLFLAISLALKPNDSGLVWLILLLAGGSFRKRALQSLAVLAVLGLPMVLWVTHASPHWPSELRENVSAISSIGGIVDPAATGMAGRNMDSLVELQTAVSIFFTEPRTFNLVTWAICAPLVVFLAFLTIRTRPDRLGLWLALAAATPLSMLPTYHFQHDAKIILLAIPACAMLWAKRGVWAWLSLLVTGAGIVMCGDIFTGIRILLTRNILVPQPNLMSRLITVILTRPAPLILLALVVFYLLAFTWQSLFKQPLGVDVENQRRESTLDGELNIAPSLNEQIIGIKNQDPDFGMPQTAQGRRPAT